MFFNEFAIYMAVFRTFGFMIQNFLDFLENSKIEGLDIIELANFQKVSFGVKCNTFVDLAKNDLENVWVDGAYGYVLRD